MFYSVTPKEKAEGIIHLPFIVIGAFLAIKSLYLLGLAVILFGFFFSKAICPSSEKKQLDIEKYFLLFLICCCLIGLLIMFFKLQK